jgi:hypothetical protein
VPIPDLDDTVAYAAWREEKLARYPQNSDAIIVEVADPFRPTLAECRKIAHAIRRSNMVIWACSPKQAVCDAADRTIPIAFGEIFGLVHLDRNLMADSDGLSSLAVSDVEKKGEFIPYTNRPIGWHTDGYYHTPERTIRSLQLWCVQSAAQGGENRLLDHEMLYLLLRDQNPEHIRALMAADVLTIPPRMEDDGDATATVARPAISGPVFSVGPQGQLHMRYTARTRSIIWKDDPASRAAVAALEALLAVNPYVLTARLEPGMGLMCNNVLHDRSGFTDTEERRRLILRGRYLDSIHADF